MSPKGVEHSTSAFQGLMAAPEDMGGDIRKFEEIGTHPAANHNAIAEALTFHHGIGAERKAERLRYLRDRWMKRLDGQPGVRINTSYDPAQSCALANIGLEGTEPAAITKHMWEKWRIMVTPINHDACPGVRVTPNVYTTLNEIDFFADRMEEVVRHPPPPISPSEEATPDRAPPSEE